MNTYCKLIILLFVPFIIYRGNATEVFSALSEKVSRLKDQGGSEPISVIRNIRESIQDGAPLILEEIRNIRTAADVRRLFELIFRQGSAIFAPYDEEAEKEFEEILAAANGEEFDSILEEFRNSLPDEMRQSTTNQFLTPEPTTLSSGEDSHGGSESINSYTSYSTGKHKDSNIKIHSSVHEGTDHKKIPDEVTKEIISDDWDSPPYVGGNLSPQESTLDSENYPQCLESIPHPEAPCDAETSSIYIRQTSVKRNFVQIHDTAAAYSAEATMTITSTVAQTSPVHRTVMATIIQPPSIITKVEYLTVTKPTTVLTLLTDEVYITKQKALNENQIEVVESYKGFTTYTPQFITITSVKHLTSMTTVIVPVTSSSTMTFTEKTFKEIAVTETGGTNWSLKKTVFDTIFSKRMVMKTTTINSVASVTMLCKEKGIFGKWHPWN